MLVKEVCQHELQGNQSSALQCGFEWGGGGLLGGTSFPFSSHIIPVNRFRKCMN